MEKEQEEQDKDLDEIKDGVKVLKNEIKLAGEGIKQVHNKVEKKTKKN